MSLSDAINRLEPRQFYTLLGGSLLLLIAAAASYVVLPQFKQLQKQLAANNALVPPSLSADDMKEVLRRKDAAIVERARQLRGDMANLPAREIEANVIDRLQNLAWRNDVVLEGVKPVLGQEIDPFQELLFTLELRGRYHALFRWLQQLRKELGSVVIKEYHMTRIDKAGVDPELRVKIVIASYRRDSS